MIFNNAGRTFFLALFASIELSGCSLLAESVDDKVERTIAYESTGSRNLFVFFDGTRNDANSKTNVWMLKESVRQAATSGLILYVEGVGNSRTPITGAGLGVGMEENIQRGYSFLAANARTNDQIYIFGFSRGAHQARALTGLIAYAGLPVGIDGMSERQRIVLTNKVLEFTKQFEDKKMESSFVQNPHVPPLMDRVSQMMSLPFRPAKIAMLGLWDTVPGSSFKDYSDCREVPDSRRGERYKTGSYPNTQRIFHAVSLDENRSKFVPILLCPAMVANMTIISEVWFSGAHADVGGGYPNGSLQSISLAWMADHLSESLGTPLNVPPPAHFSAIAHWPINDQMSSFGSHCQPRVVPVNAKIHTSAVERRTAGVADVEDRGIIERRPYPTRCP